MFCSQCGAQIRDEAQFCDTCGAPQGQQASPPRIARKTKGIAEAFILVVATGVLIILIAVKISSINSPPGSSPEYGTTRPAAEETPAPPSLQISSIKCTATVVYGISNIYFTIHIAGSRTGSGEFSETVLGHNVGSREYPTGLRSSLSSADGQTVLGGSLVSVPDHLEVGQKFEATDQIFYSPAARRSARRTGAPGWYTVFEPEGCSGGSCVGGVLHATCRWAGEGDP
jgi:hypothetical protein